MRDLESQQIIEPDTLDTYYRKPVGLIILLLFCIKIVTDLIIAHK